MTATTRAPAGPSKERQQPGDQRERPDDHGREGRFEAVWALAPFGEERAGVVDQYVEAWFALEDPLGCGPDRVEGRHIGDDRSKPILAVLGDQVVADRREPVPIATDEDQPRAEGGEGVGHDPTQAGRGAGDEDRPTSKRAPVRRRPREDAPPNRVPDA